MLAQVVLAVLGLVVAVLAGFLTWVTHRFTIESQPVDFEIEVAHRRPSPPGVLPMTIQCKSARAYVHQVWCPDWDGGDADSVPEVTGIEAQQLDGGDVRMFWVRVPPTVTRFRLVATCSVDKRGRKRNVWSEWIDMEQRVDV